MRLTHRLSFAWTCSLPTRVHGRGARGLRLAWRRKRRERRERDFPGAREFKHAVPEISFLTALLSQIASNL